MITLQWKDIPIDVWEIIIDYLSDFKWIKEKTDWGFSTVNKNFYYLTYDHAQMFDGWTNIMANYWKNKRKRLKHRPEYQLHKLMCCIEKSMRECEECGYVKGEALSCYWCEDSRAENT